MTARARIDLRRPTLLPRLETTDRECLVIPSHCVPSGEDPVRPFGNVGNDDDPLNIRSADQ